MTVVLDVVVFQTLANIIVKNTLDVTRHTIFYGIIRSHCYTVSILSAMSELRPLLRLPMIVTSLEVQMNKVLYHSTRGI